MDLSNLEWAPPNGAPTNPFKNVQFYMDDPPKVEVATVDDLCDTCADTKWEPGMTLFLCEEHLREATGQPRSILGDAAKIVAGDRQAAYGKPENNFGKIASIWSGILGDKLAVDITPEEVALCMVGLKLARESWQHKRDNLVDAVGYVLLADQLAGDE